MTIPAAIAILCLVTLAGWALVALMCLTAEKI